MFIKIFNRHTKKCTVLALVLFLYDISWTSAQAKYLSQQHIFHHISELHGIKSTTFNDILVDHNGGIWAITSQGGQPGGSYLLKFDGYKFKTFGINFHAKNHLKPYSLTCLFEDSAGRIFIGSNKGLMYYSPSDNSFYECHSKNKKENFFSSL